MPTFNTYIYSNDGNTLYGKYTNSGPSGSGDIVAQNGIINTAPSEWTVYNGATVSTTDSSFILPITIQGLTLTANSTNIDVAIGQSILYNNSYYCVEASTPTLTFKHFFDAGLQGTGTIKFRHYSQQEPSTGETWVLNPSYSNKSHDFTGLSFNSNGETFSSIKVVGGFSNDELYYDNKDIAYIQDDDYVDWKAGEAYKTLIFQTAPTGDLLTWLQANGTKQGGGGAVIKAGTYLFNEELTRVSSGNNLDLDFIAKGNSLTAVNVYGSQIDIEHIVVQDTGYLLLYTVDDYIEWDLYTWQYQHEVTEEDWITYTADDTTKLRTIIVETDQTVSEEFYIWFTANTTKLS